MKTYHVCAVLFAFVFCCCIAVLVSARASAWGTAKDAIGAGELAGSGAKACLAASAGVYDLLGDPAGDQTTITMDGANDIDISSVVSLLDADLRVQPGSLYIDSSYYPGCCGVSSGPFLCPVCGKGFVLVPESTYEITDEGYLWCAGCTKQKSGAVASFEAASGLK